MKIEEQVCSLNLAERLKELGVKQESLFAWKMGTVQNGGDIVIKVPERSTIVQSNLKAEPCLWKNDMWGDHFAAFTVAELGEMLPPHVTVDDEIRTIRFDKTSKAHFVQYRRDEFNLCIQNGDTEANARAKMMIYLIENNLIEI